MADVADRIAYNCHDLEDGLRARLIEGNQMRHVQIYVEATRKVGVERIPDWTIRRTRTAKTITDRLVSDCIDNSRRQIAEAGIRTAYDACNRAEDLVSLSPESDRQLAELERFLHANFYGHEKLLAAAQRTRGWLTELFEQLCREPHRMPSYFRDFIPEYGLQRAVCDYIAGMTDRYCLKLPRRDSTVDYLLQGYSACGTLMAVSPMIEQITIKNFKSFKDVSLKLGPLNIFIGANASGKSNFFDALRVLQGIGYGFTHSRNPGRQAQERHKRGLGRHPRRKHRRLHLLLEDADRNPRSFQDDGKSCARMATSSFKFRIAFSAKEGRLREEHLSVRGSSSMTLHR